MAEACREVNEEWMRDCARVDVFDRALGEGDEVEADCVAPIWKATSETGVVERL
jgi:hypothetical protein